MLRLETASLVDLFDASYAASPDDKAWTTRVLRALMSLTSARTGASFHFTSDYDQNGFRLRSLTGDTAIGPDGESGTTLNAIVSWRPPVDATERILGRTQGDTATATTRLGADLAQSPGWRECWPAPIVDSLGLVSRDANGDGLCAVVGLDRVTALSPRESRVMTKLATHVGAGDRLRRAQRPRVLDDADAIFTPSGKVLHAQESARDNQPALDEGRRRRDEARRTTHDVEKALEIWKGLVAGRWSLVDHLDTDGKRFLLAIRNAPSVDKRADLTPRERRACALVAMGHPDKEVAYMLGISTASVSASLHRARQKLGVGSRADLVALWRRATGSDPRSAE